MRNRLIYVLTTGLSLSVLWLACQSKPVPAAVDVRMETFAYKRCVRDSLCVEVNAVYPVVSSSDAALAQRLTDTLQSIVWETMDVGEAADIAPSTPFRQRLETLGPKLLATLEADYGQDTAFTEMFYTVDTKSELLLNAPRYLSIDVSTYQFMGGAHGLGITTLYTVHKASGRRIESLTEVIADTAALRPLIEQAFLEANRAKDLDQEITMESLLLEPDVPLPLPINFCIVPEGVRMVYNPYEVTAYALGPTDFVLTWEKLGRLASRDKWMK
jgi:hypothetical protein